MLAAPVRISGLARSHRPQIGLALMPTCLVVRGRANDKNAAKGEGHCNWHPEISTCTVPSNTDPYILPYTPICMCHLTHTHYANCPSNGLHVHGNQWG